MDDPGLLQPAVLSPSLLDILTQQRTGNEAGVRLAFHQTLLDRQPFQKEPLLWCALMGANGCALLLHERGVKPCAPIHVASFQAGGASGNTPLHKGIAVSLREVALLAGHASTSRILKNVEAGIPLRWSPQNHHKWPPNFRKEVWKAAEGCCTTAALVSLPGPARVAIMQLIVTDLVHSMVWKDVPAAVWEGAWDKAMGPELMRDALAVPPSECAPPFVRPARAIEYQFRMNQPAPQRQGERMRARVRKVVGLAFWCLAARGRRKPASPLAMAVGAVASVMLPTQVVILLSLGMQLSTIL